MKHDPNPKDLRRRQILEAALATFATRGYEKTTMEDIRLASELSKGTLYLYFDSKEALFAAVVETTFEEQLIYLDKLVNEYQSHSAAEQLQILLTSLTAMLEQEDQQIGLYTDFFVQSWQYESVRAVLTHVYTQYMDLFINLIQQGIASKEFYPVNTEHTARMMIGAIDGILLQKLLDPNLDFKPILNQLIELILRGLKVR